MEWLVNHMKASQPVTVVLGAGISVAAGVPASKVLLKHFEDEYREQLTEHRTRLRHVAEEKGVSVPRYTLDQAISGVIEANESAGQAWFKRVIVPFFPSRTHLKTRPPGQAIERDVAPTCAHEVLAHWLYFRGVQWVIDFNFDELFEVAFEDEAGDYEMCATTPEFATAADRLEAGPDSQGVDRYRVLKPHGTVSSPSSLVKEPEQVGAFPPETRRVITAVLQSADLVVFIGYSFGEPDLLEVLRQIAGDGKSYVIVSRNPEREPLAAFERHTGSHAKYVPMEADRFIEAVLDRLRESHKEGKPAHLWGVHRHEIRAAIWRLGVPASAENRLTLAYFIHAVKQRGYFSVVPTALDSCRRLGHARLRSPELLSAVFRKLCDSGVFERYTGEYYRIRDMPAADKKKLNDRFLEALAAHLEQGERIRRASGAQREHLIDLFVKLQDDPDVEVEAADAAVEVEFPTAMQLRSLPAVWETDRAIVETAEKRLCIVSECGAWLARDSQLRAEIMNRGLRVQLVLTGTLAPEGSLQRNRQRHNFKEVLRQFGERIKVFALADEPGFRILVNDDAGVGTGLFFRRRNKAVKAVFWRVGKDGEVARLREGFADCLQRAKRVRAFEQLEAVLDGGGRQ